MFYELPYQELWAIFTERVMRSIGSLERMGQIVDQQFRHYGAQFTEIRQDAKVRATQFVGERFITCAPPLLPDKFRDHGIYTFEYDLYREGD